MEQSEKTKKFVDHVERMVDKGEVKNYAQIIRALDWSKTIFSSVINGRKNIPNDVYLKFKKVYCIEDELNTQPPAQPRPDPPSPAIADLARSNVILVETNKSLVDMIRVINGAALPLWMEQLDGNYLPGCYIFGDDLKPGERKQPLRREQITRRWETHVKSKLGIEVNFYNLKHLFLELAAGKYGIGAAQGLANHATPVVTMTHYATGHKQRELDEKKRVEVSLTGN